VIPSPMWATSGSRSEGIRIPGLDPAEQGRG
jgi:hypothetical protein